MKKEKIKNILKRQNGITLVALVVTIIVLIILAVISINLVFNKDGIIGKAEKIKDIQRAAEVADQVELWKGDKTLSGYMNEGKQSLDDFLTDLIQKGLITEAEKAIIQETGSITIGGRTIEFKKVNATISFASNEVTIIKGKTGTIEPIIEPSTADIELIWNSSDTSIATVQDGKINAVSNGKTTINCEIADQSDSKVECVVNVSDGSEIYALGRDGNILDFKDIPNNAKLQVWEHYRGLRPPDHSCVNSTPTYIVPEKEVSTGAFTDMYYRLQDSYGNFSEYYYFYVEQLCFARDTKISTPNGTKNIQDIKVGDIVFSMNLEKNQVEEKKVIQTFVNVVDYKTAKIYIGDEYIECTTGHEVYTLNKGWMKAAYLGAGDILLSRNKGQEVVTNVELIKKEEKLNVYNFEVEDNHNYFVGEKESLVHNLPESLCNIEGNTYRGTVLEL